MRAVGGCAQHEEHTKKHFEWSLRIPFSDLQKLFSQRMLIYISDRNTSFCVLLILKFKSIYFNSFEKQGDTSLLSICPVLKFLKQPELS